MLMRFIPGNLRTTIGRPRGIIATGAVLVVLALLANSAGLAIFIAALVVPIAVLIDLSRRDLFEVEPWWAPLTMASAGALAAIFVTLMNILLLKQFESEVDPSSSCCGVFMGRVNLDIRDVGALSTITVGLILPILAEVLKTGGPLYLRQQPIFRNEVMDGVTLGAAAGGGYAAAAAILYFWPLVNGSPSLGGSVSGWTSALIGLLVVRPLISCASTGLICAGIWHYGMHPRINAIAIPVGSALSGTAILAIGSLLIADKSSLAELIWNILILFALLAASRYVLQQAMGQDRQALSAPIGDRIICPTCGNPTKPGVYCTNCGASLSPVVTPPPSQVIEVDSSPTPSEDAETEPTATDGPLPETR